jgi:hypothetical protein
MFPRLHNNRRSCVFAMPSHAANVAMQRCDKHITAAANQHTTVSKGLVTSAFGSDVILQRVTSATVEIAFGFHVSDRGFIAETEVCLQPVLGGRQAQEVCSWGRLCDLKTLFMECMIQWFEVIVSVLRALYCLCISVIKSECVTKC